MQSIIVGPVLINFINSLSLYQNPMKKNGGGQNSGGQNTSHNCKGGRTLAILWDREDKMPILSKHLIYIVLMVL